MYRGAVVPPGFVLPPLLRTLVEAGRWPRTQEEALKQNTSPRVSGDRIRALAPEESLIFLEPPPFSTVRQLGAAHPFWRGPMADPNGIDPDRTIVLGDFGLGSDAPIALDYRHDAANPRVIRLRWVGPDTPNRWVVMAPDFASFAAALGL